MAFEFHPIAQQELEEAVSYSISHIGEAQKLLLLGKRQEAFLQ